MSNLIFNLRIKTWHFQIMRDRPFIRIYRNMYYYKNPNFPWMELY